jgi:hypothetical protein
MRTVGTRLRVCLESRTGFDCIARSTDKRVERGKHEYSLTGALDLTSPRAQGYRVKRISACGGCLGDYRR